MNAQELVNSLETAWVLRADGTTLVLKENDTGTVGPVAIDPRRAVDKVIIYLEGDPADIYVGQVEEIDQGLGEDDCWYIRLEGMAHEGTTQVAWETFAGIQDNNVRFLQPTP